MGDYDQGVNIEVTPEVNISDDSTSSTNVIANDSGSAASRQKVAPYNQQWSENYENAEAIKTLEEIFGATKKEIIWAAETKELDRLRRLLDDDCNMQGRNYYESHPQSSRTTHTNVVKSSNAWAKNVDIRGVKRGRCLESSCDCTEYLYNSQNGPRCFYCTCAPTKHVKLGTVETMPDNNTEDVVVVTEHILPTLQPPPPPQIPSSSVNANTSSYGSGPSNVNYQPSLNLTPDSSESTTETNSASPTKNSTGAGMTNKLRSLLPAKLPKDVAIALEKSNLTPPLRNKVVRILADRCYAADIPTKYVNLVADLAVERWGSLKSAYGHKSKNLADQIKRRIYKLRACGGQKSDDESEESNRSSKSSVTGSPQNKIYGDKLSGYASSSGIEKSLEDSSSVDSRSPQNMHSIDKTPDKDFCHGVASAPNSLVTNQTPPSNRILDESQASLTNNSLIGTPSERDFCHIVPPPANPNQPVPVNTPSPNRVIDENQGTMTNLTNPQRDFCHIVQPPPPPPNPHNPIQNLNQIPPATRVIDENQISVTPSSESMQRLYALLPLKFPKDIEIALEKHTLSHNHRNKIVRILADRCYSADIPINDVSALADLAVQRWRPLKSEYGHKSRNLAVQLRRRIYKLRACSRKGDEQDEDDEQSEIYSENIHLMMEEMQRDQPSLVNLRSYLNVVRKKRRLDTNRMDIKNHLELYPALKIPDMIIFEFCMITETNLEEMVDRWIACLYKLDKYLIACGHPFPQNCVSNESKTIHILLELPRLIPSGKKTRSATKFVLELFEPNTPVEQTVTVAAEPPRLVAVHNPESMCLVFRCYAEEMLLFTSTNPIMALLMLLGVYFIFDIEFPIEARPSFLFLSAVVLKDKAPEHLLQKCTSAVTMLQQLQL